MTDSFEAIVVENDRGVCTITFNRPDRLNAFNRGLVREVQAALDAIENDAETRAVVVCGAGRVFSAGFDLKDDAAMGVRGVKGWRTVLEEDFSFLTRWWGFSKPTIAAVHGYCLAGAGELAMACDITIAEAGTVFGQPELKFGSVTTSLMLPWLAGPKAAKEILLTGEDRISAERALQLKLVNEVVPAGQHVTRAREMARQIAVMDPDAVQMTKQAINRSYEVMGLGAALAANLDIAIQIEALETPERLEFREITRVEGLKAALAWREKRFSGSA